MTYIEKIEKGDDPNHELHGMKILLNIDCPTCGKHEVCSRSYMVYNPMLISSDPHITITVGCAYCNELAIWHGDPHLSAESYEMILDRSLVPDWLDRMSRNDNIHAWKRDNLFNIANGGESEEFWEHAGRVRMKAVLARYREYGGAEE